MLQQSYSLHRMKPILASWWSLDSVMHLFKATLLFICNCRCLQLGSKVYLAKYGQQSMCIEKGTEIARFELQTLDIACLHPTGLSCLIRLKRWRRDFTKFDIKTGSTTWTPFVNSAIILIRTNLLWMKCPRTSYKRL